jgi:hypothetical protein
MQYDLLVRAAKASRTRLSNLGFPFNHIFAKIYVQQPKGQEPIPLTNGNKGLLDGAFVFVAIPPPYLSSTGGDAAAAIAAERAYTNRIDAYLKPEFQSRLHSDSHPKTKINMSEMIGRKLIYSRNDPLTPDITEYWYLVQNLDILSGFKRAVYDPVIHGAGVRENAVNGDDVARGYIMLVPEKDFQQFTPVGTSDIMYAHPTSASSASSASSKGGNKCSLKPKSNKRKKKQNKHNSRRRYRSRKH